MLKDIRISSCFEFPSFARVGSGFEQIIQRSYLYFL